MTNYDSTAETLRHIRLVASLLAKCAAELVERAGEHDHSKLQEPEKSAFDRETPLLKTLTYGSDEYKASLVRLGEALAHHYANNSHHPDHYENGVSDMTLFDVIEMTCDWIAAAKRGRDGAVNMEVNVRRFGLEPQLASILTNTIRTLTERPG